MALAVRTEDSGPADKDPGAFRTITEVADALDVPQHVLRFWETRFGQIRPVKRAGGRRYYRPGDVALVAGIRHLLHVQRYTIEGAQRVLKENGVRFVQAVGRGEAVAASPLMPETERRAGADAAAITAGPGGYDRGTAPCDASDRQGSDRAALSAALQDLYACRDALAALRAAPDA